MVNRIASSVRVRISSGKCLIARRIGFGAAWPRPQMLASAIVLAELAEKLAVPALGLHQLHRLGAADPARRALAAALVGEEAQHVERRRPRAVPVGEDHHGRRADEGAVRLQRVEVERHVVERGGQQPGRRPAGLVGLEGMALDHAAGRLDQVARRRAGRQQVDARARHPPGDREAPPPAPAVRPVRGKHLRPLAADPRRPVQRLDVLDQRRPAEEPDLRDVGRPVPRQAALALDQLEHRRFLAADVGAGAAAELDVAGRDETRPPRARRSRGAGSRATAGYSSRM